MRHQWKWTAHQIDKLNKVVEGFQELEAYKSLTLRQIYYQLVGKGYIENTTSFDEFHLVIDTLHCAIGDPLVEIVEYLLPPMPN